GQRGRPAPRLHPRPHAGARGPRPRRSRSLEPAPEGLEAEAREAQLARLVPQQLQTLGGPRYERRPALQEDRERHPDRQRHQNAPGPEALGRGAAGGKRLREEPPCPDQLRTSAPGPPPSPNGAWPRPCRLSGRRSGSSTSATPSRGWWATAAARTPA